jgi:hypothetical protein
MNQLTVSLQHSIATLAAKGWSSRKIARELDLDRETVRRYRPASDSKPAIPPTGSTDLSDPKPAIVPAGCKAGRTSQCVPLSGIIEQGMLAGLSEQGRVSTIGWPATVANEVGIIKSEARLV